MNIKLSAKFQKEIKYLALRNPQLVQKIEKQLKLFASNNLHPSLRTHKLSGNQSDSWSISVARSIRMVYTQLPGGFAYFYLIGTHDEVYRK